MTVSSFIHYQSTYQQKQWHKDLLQAQLVPPDLCS